MAHDRHRPAVQGRCRCDDQLVETASAIGVSPDTNSNVRPAVLGDVVAVARRCLKESRIGHTGTLDPLATGVLPLACGRATRLVRFLSASKKHYEATIRFGVTTDSYDITGDEVGRTDRVPSREAVERVLDSLRGEHLQMPPAFSAKKVAGQRAYAMARRAEPVALQPVSVRLIAVDVLEFTGPFLLPPR